MNPKFYAKAIVGALIAGTSAAIPLVDDGLVASEILGIALATLTAFAGVYFTPNDEVVEAGDVEVHETGI